MDNRSISHTRWKCQYHIVFIPKYRKKLCLTQRHSKIYMHSKAEPHYIGIELRKSKGRGVFRQRIKIHLEEIQGEFSIDIVKLILILAIVFF